MMEGYVAVFWQSEPLVGVLSFGSGALVAWVLVAVMVGLLLSGRHQQHAH